MTNWELASQVCSWSAQLRAARRTHLDQHGRLVPPVFMAAILERIGECQAALTDAASPERDELEAILSVLDQGMRRGDEATRATVATAFVATAREQPYFDALSNLLGPNLRAEAQA